MSTEEALGWFINLLETFGPWVIGIVGVFFLAVLAVAVFIFVKAFRSMSRMDKEFDRKWNGLR